VFDIDVKEIEQAIERTSPETEKKVDWSQAWAKKYPILLEYQKEVDVKPYAAQLEAMLEQLKSGYGYQDLDAFLVLKDILAKVWTEREKQTGAGETGE